MDRKYSMRFLKSAAWSAIVACLLVACQSRKIDNSMLVEVEGPVSFARDIRPIFINSCGGGACHIDERTSGVRLSTYQQVVSSVGVQYEEKIVDPGNAEDSPLLDKLRPSPKFGVRMPRGRAPLSQRKIALIRIWINEGARNN